MSNLRVDEIIDRIKYMERLIEEYSYLLEAITDTCDPDIAAHVICRHRELLDNLNYE